MDFGRRKRIRDKTCYDFKRMETQEELNAVMKADYEKWDQKMKDAEAWFDESRSDAALRADISAPPLACPGVRDRSPADG